MFGRFTPYQHRSLAMYLTVLGPTVLLAGAESSPGPKRRRPGPFSFLAAAVLASLTDFLTDGQAPSWLVRVGTCLVLHFPGGNLWLCLDRLGLLVRELGRRLGVCSSGELGRRLGSARPGARPPPGSARPGARPPPGGRSSGSSAAAGVCSSGSSAAAWWCSSGSSAAAGVCSSGSSAAASSRSFPAPLRNRRIALRNRPIAGS